MTPDEVKALKDEMLSCFHCVLPGKILSFNEEKQTARIQPGVKVGSLAYPVLQDVPVFMPVPFEVHPGEACLVVFADIDMDAWFDTGEAEKPRSARKHSLSDGFAFVGWRVGS